MTYMTKKIFILLCLSFYTVSIISAASSAEARFKKWQDQLVFKIHMGEPSEDHLELYRNWRPSLKCADEYDDIFQIDDLGNLYSLYPVGLFESFYKILEVRDPGNNNALVAYAIFLTKIKQLKKNQLRSNNIGKESLIASLAEYVWDVSLSEQKRKTIFGTIILSNLFETHSKIETLVLDTDSDTRSIVQDAGFEQCYFRELSPDQKLKKGAYVNFWSHFPKQLQEKYDGLFSTGRVTKYLKSCSE